MAGKRQHYIWQMQQRGFSWTEHGESHVWLYEKGKAPRQSVTRKIGVENFFYGEVDSIADQNISVFERSFQNFIIEARNAVDGASLCVESCAALAVHLEFRNRFLRMEIESLVSNFLVAAGSKISSKRNLKALVQKLSEEFPSNIEKLITEDEEFLNEFQTKVQEEISKAIPQMPERIRASHIRSLQKDFTKFPRSQRYMELSFGIKRSKGSQFILPDTTISFVTEEMCSPFPFSDKPIEAILIPISSEVCIVGKRKEKFDRDVATILRILSSTSERFFLAKTKSTELMKLSARIGRNAKPAPSHVRAKFLQLNGLFK